MNREQYTDALALIRGFLVENPLDIWFVNQAGHALYLMDRYDEAKELILKTPGLEANHYTHRILGNCYREKELFEEAIGQYSLALHMKENAIARFFLGWCQGRLERIDAAIASYERAIQIDPNFDEAMVNLALELEDADPDRAVALIRRAIEVDPDYTWAIQQLGRILLAQRKSDDAKCALQRAMELDPNDYDTKLYLAAALDDLNEPDEELQILLSAREDEPTDPLVHRMLGNLYLGCDQYVEANNSYEQAYELDSTNARAVYGIARTQHAMGNHEEAIKWLRRVRELEPDFDDKYGLAATLGL